jgi:hypothetical protein
MMFGMAVQRNPATDEMSKGAIAPVIGMGVRQQDGMHVGPGTVGGAEPLGELAGTETAVDEHAEPIRLDQRRIAAATARQDREPQRHALSFSADTEAAKLLS